MNNVSFHQKTSRELDFLEHNSIDVICSISVFIHLNLYDMFWYFSEFKRVVRTGGRIWIDVADSESLDFNGKNINGEAFLRMAKSYKENPSCLPGLMNWNSIKSVINIANHFGFENSYNNVDGGLVFKKKS